MLRNGTKRRRRSSSTFSRLARGMPSKLSRRLRTTRLLRRKRLFWRPVITLRRSRKSKSRKRSSYWQMLGLVRPTTSVRRWPIRSSSIRPPNSCTRSVRQPWLPTSSDTLARSTPLNSPKTWWRRSTPVPFILFTLKPMLTSSVTNVSDHFLHFWLTN